MTMTPDDEQERRHRAAMEYTEEQARLLMAVRDMVRWEVKRQLESMDIEALRDEVLGKSDINH